MKSILIVAFSIAIFFTSCTKEPGDGGNCTIKGKVEKDIRVVLSNPATYQYTVEAADEDVYIVYGDHLSPDDRINTNFNGEFEFLNLRPGKYTVYVYSKDTTGVSAIDPDHMVISEEVEISDKKQTIDLPVLTIYDSN